MCDLQRWPGSLDKSDTPRNAHVASRRTCDTIASRRGDDIANCQQFKRDESTTQGHLWGSRPAWLVRGTRLVVRSLCGLGVGGSWAIVERTWLE